MVCGWRFTYVVREAPWGFCSAVSPPLSSNSNEGRKSKHVRYENYFPKKVIMVSYLFSIAE